MSSPSLSVRLVGESGKALLKLEGTVLLCIQKNWCREFTLLIPVESVQMSEHARLKKDLSLLVFLIPIIAILLVVVGYLAIPGEAVDRESLVVMCWTVVFVTVVLDSWLLLGYLLSFLLTKNSIRMIFGDGRMAIEFWKTRKIAHLFGDFEKAIRETQNHAQESSTPSSTEVFEIREINHIRSLILLSILLCLPAAALHMPTLLVLGLAPTGWHLFKTIRLMEHPREYREAVRAYKRKDWERAILHLKSLLEQTPQYTAAKLFLMDVYMRAEHFDDALRIAGTIPDEYLEDSNALQLTIWKWKRVHLRRNEYP